MTAARMLARRAKLIDQMVPQAVESWAKHQLLGTPPSSPSRRALDHIADQLMHVGYGSSAGALYGFALGKGPASVAKVVGYGLAVWGFGSFVLLPGLQVLRPEWRARPSEFVVNLGAHLLYASALALLTEEFEKQSFTQPAHPASKVAVTG